MNENKDVELQLEIQCVDNAELGNLYALNKKLPEEELKKLEPYMKYYRLEDYKDIMQVEGDPRGWLCTFEDAPKVEEMLGITETLKVREERRKEERERLAKKRKEKDAAMDKIEKVFAGAPRPNVTLKELLKYAKIIYDPADQFLEKQDNGAGQLYIITDSDIWYIINNGQDDDNWSLNNVMIKDKGGAIGFKLPYTKSVHDLIKIVTDDNKYKGEI